MPDGWNECVQSYRYYLKGLGKAEQTIRTYSYAIRAFGLWCLDRETHPHEVTRQMVRIWITERQEHVSPQRAHNELAAARLYYNQLMDDGVRGDNPTAGIRVKRTKALPTVPVEVADFQAMLTACQTERERLLIMVMGYTGLRISEIAGMRAENIDWSHNVITVSGKGDKERRVGVNPEVVNWLRAFLGMFPEPGPIWRSDSKASYGEPLSVSGLRWLISSIAKRAGVAEIHAHRFRAMYATAMMEQHGDIQALQGQMGHSSIETTSLYSYWTRDRRGLEQSSSLRLVAG